MKFDLFIKFKYKVVSPHGVYIGKGREAVFILCRGLYSFDEKVNLVTRKADFAIGEKMTKKEKLNPFLLHFCWAYSINGFR